jgi:hypothetical protein
MLDAHLGKPFTAGALTVFPVWNGAAVADPGYDLQSASLSVTELDGAPVVGQLDLINRGPRPALVLEGELLQGGQQHRVAARSVLVPAEASLVLDVRCVEQGRWSGSAHHTRGGSRAPARVRARTAEGQAAVWREVSTFEAAHGKSRTHSLVDVAGAVEDRVSRVARDRRPLPFQSGVVIGVAGQPLLLEVFDSPRTLEECWDQLLQAATLDAAGSPEVPTPSRRARRFVDRLSAVALPSPRRAAGAGHETGGASSSVRTSTLSWQDRAVHTVGPNLRHELVAA